LLNQKTDDGKPKSIVVTTGTGSGKTECFMMPLVHDLSLQGKQNEIQAIFLYPLNALMEDQKDRLETLLKNTNLTYAVYNGDLPEREPKQDDNCPEAAKTRRKILNTNGVSTVFSVIPPTNGPKPLQGEKPVNPFSNTQLSKQAPNVKKKMLIICGRIPSKSNRFSIP
jgi:ATP-dependent helicase YprA (DUF1998 family)